MSDEKSFSVCQEMLPLFRAVLKFIKYGIESNVSIFMGFQIANEDVFHDFGNLVI